jgi:hypothetical protein
MGKFPYQANRFCRRNWPPECEGNPDVDHDGDTYEGSADALIAAGVLRPQDTPGHPACPRQWARFGFCNGIKFGAWRLGSRIFVSVYRDVTIDKLKG